jgi:hypothetical protein
MASTHKSLRSSTASKRPTTSIADGQIALNTNAASPGLFFKDSTGADIIKVGPVHVGTTAPNATPAVGGSSGNSTGEVWLDTSLTPVGVKIWNGSAWQNATPAGSTTVQGLLELATNGETQTGTDTARAVTPAGLQSKLSDSTSTTSSTTIASSTAVKSAYDLANDALPKSGGVITGNLEIGTTGSLTFEGATDNAFETALAVVDPTADRTITFPDRTGTVITNADTGTVTSTMIADGTIVNADINASAAIALSKLASGALPSGITVASANIVDGTIVNADVNASAAIAGTKISPNFGAQNLTVDTNVLYVDATTDRVGIGSSSPAVKLQVSESSAGEVEVARFRIEGQTNNPMLRVLSDEANQTITLDASGSTTGTELVFKEGNSEAFRIDSSGRLGLGTSSPGATLDVNGTAIIGDAGAYGQLTIDKTAVFNASDVPTSTTLYLTNRSGGTEGNGNYGPSIGFGRINNSLRPGGAIATIQTSSDADQCGLAFLTHSSDITSNELQEALRITHDGKVGIGATSPGALLHLSSATGSASPTPTELRIESTTNAGDWTANSPWGRIAFYSADTSGSGPKVDAAISVAKNGATGGNSSFIFQLDEGTGAGLENKVIIKQDGSVGIGTTAAHSRLYIQDSNTGEQLTIRSTSGNSGVAGLRFNIADSSVTTDQYSKGSILFVGDGIGSGRGSITFNINNVNDATNVSTSNERMRIDGSGRLLLGASSAINTVTNGLSSASYLTVAGTSTAPTNIGAFYFNNNQSGAPSFSLSKSRSTTVGSHTILSNGDRIGSISYSGSDGSAFIEAARIGAEVEGTPGANDMPGRLVFSTTAGGASDPTERVRITSTGEVTVNSGFVTLNGNKVGGISVVIADNAFASITPPRIGAGFVAVAHNPDSAFPNAGCQGFVYADWGNSPVVTQISVGTSFETSTSGPPTGTTGSDNHATLFVGGTSGTVYLENRIGSEAAFFVTFT